MESEHQDPKHISEMLDDAVGADVDGERKEVVIRADLTSENEGIVEEIADIQEDMHRTGDPALPDVLDQRTGDAISVQRELQDLDDNQPNR